MDSSDLDDKISSERRDLIEEKLIEFMIEESFNASNARIFSIGSR